MALAEPSRLHAPLEGGREGATVVVHPLVCAWVQAPPEMFVKQYGLLRSVTRMLRGPRPDWVPLPITAFFLEHPSVGPIIIDTGLHASVGVDPKQSFGRFLGRMYRGIEMTPEQTVAAQVRARGIAPRDVKVAIITHLH